MGLRLTTYLHLVPRLRISGASPPFPPTIYITLFHNELILKDYMKCHLDIMLNGDDKLIVRDYIGLITAKMAPSTMFSRNCRCQI
jgi:hypothetical protein